MIVFGIIASVENGNWSERHLNDESSARNAAAAASIAATASVTATITTTDTATNTYVAATTTFFVGLGSTNIIISHNYDDCTIQRACNATSNAS